MNSLVPILLFLLTHTVDSRQGQYFGVIEFGRGSELTVQSFTLYRRNHEIIYRKITPQANTFFITDLGSVFALNERNLFFYEQNGTEIWLKALDYPNGFRFAADHTLFLSSDKDGIFVYANNGKLMYELRPGRLFSCDEDGRQIAVVSNDTLFFYEDGALKFSSMLASPYARDLEFSGDKKSLIIKEPHGVEILDVTSGRISTE